MNANLRRCNRTKRVAKCSLTEYQHLLGLSSGYLRLEHNGPIHLRRIARPENITSPGLALFGRLKDEVNGAVKRA